MNIPSTLRHFAAIADFLFPPTCYGCGATLPEGSRYICPVCAAALPRTGYEKLHDNPVADRLAGKIPFRQASSHFFYTHTGIVGTLVQDFKYRQVPGLARELGRMMGAELNDTPLITETDILMPVPLHWTRRMRRGYSQTRMIARGISETTGLPVSDDLAAIRPHRTQTHLTPEQRLRNTEGVFRLRHPENYASAKILIIDDICTTGATLIAAADAILAASPDSALSMLTLASPS